jgi:hypothetical protein
MSAITPANTPPPTEPLQPTTTARQIVLAVACTCVLDQSGPPFGCRINEKRDKEAILAKYSSIVLKHSARSARRSYARRSAPLLQAAKTQRARVPGRDARDERDPRRWRRTGDIKVNADVIAPPPGELFSETNDNSRAILLTYGHDLRPARDGEDREEYVLSDTYTRR